MRTQHTSFHRRQLFQGFGQFAALSAASSAFSCVPVGDGTADTVLTPGRPEDVGMSSERLEDVFARIQRRVNDGLFPGATALIARHGKIVGHRAFGVKVAGEPDPVTLDTIFDLESLTKVLSTAAVAAVLAQQGVLRLEDTVAMYLPDFAANGKADVTIYDMLRYSAGLPLDNQFLNEPDDDTVWRLMAETPLEYPPGTSVLYSDLTYRLLGRTLANAAGVDLNTFARTHVWAPLGMHDTMYTPPAALVPRIAATGFSAIRGGLVRGAVQDEQDFALGGIVGCDGVFSTAMDLAIFCQMFLNGGSYGGVQVLEPELVYAMTENRTPQVTAADTDLSPIANLLLTPKGIGWELWSHRFSPAGMRLSPSAYGKSGGAGTFMWVEPELDLFGIILTNHGLPQPFDELGWNRMLDKIGCTEFFDGMVQAVSS